MFKGMHHLGFCDGDGFPVYELLDSDFCVQVSLNSHVSTAIKSTCGRGALAIIIEYKSRNLPIAKNLALFYASCEASKTLFCPDKYKWIEMHKPWLDEYRPELEYGTKIYPCMLNHLKKLEYIGKCKQKKI